MKRKSVSLGAATLCAIGLFTAGFADSSSAVAQEQDFVAEASEANAEDMAEIVPIFVAKEMVQDVPEEPEIVEPEISARSLRELVAATATDDQLSRDMHCLAGAIYFESRGEPLAGQLAVGQVILNRTESGQFPSDYCGVVYQRSQFSFVRGGTMPQIRTSSTAWKNAVAIAKIVHHGHWESEAADSLYFHAKYVKPRWASRKSARATISTHVFYR